MALPQLPANFDRELSKAVMNEEKEKVIELCRQFPEGPLHVISIHDDTVLHMATYTEEADFVVDLLKKIPQDQLRKMAHKNKVGNTILHEAASSNKLVRAAEEMLLKAPDLLEISNEFQETALFRAARYGKIEMFKFLDGEVNKKFSAEHRDTFYRKNDKSTILHVSILAAHFDLALYIAENYPFLIGEQDDKGMTALHHLSCNASAFKSRRRKCLKRFINSCLRLPLWEAVQKDVTRYDSALKLARLLIEMDTSWKDTDQLVDGREGGEDSSSSDTDLHEKEGNGNGEKPNESIKKPKVPTPLLLATEYGCVEIVKEIIERYPQAVEHVDDKGRTILHIAIKYRQIEIFNMVEGIKISMKRLVRKCDDDYNSILHMVGFKAKHCKTDDMRSPALQLQGEWHLFERIQNICSAHFFRHINKKGKTAEEIFEKKNKDLRKNAEEWLKRTSENSSIVAVLIATVAFAAAYTVPGGSNQNTGVPILLNQTFFVVFTITDVLSLTFALTSVIIFLSILTSPFRLIDFKQSLPQKLMLGFTCLIFSVSMMMLAFAATIILVIHNKGQWTKIALYTAAFLPVCVFAFSYLPLYSSLLRTFKYSINKIVTVFSPFFNSFFKSRESPIPIPSTLEP
ncbi:hypothetical protein F0562_008390 [Nyssa sinensis]|uniref:PGG domain-containing protein n=1 Tax=Nyssa sinensis TaxID=561372 RepID=A0A5J5AAF0_9ASTE|nr:hypothetical protein F0562_008390 [Nyssa sinensis]